MLPRNDFLLLSLTRDGRLTSLHSFETFENRLRRATDCFVFCHGWLHDQAEAREGAERFFACLEVALRPLGERVVPVRVAVHWPSKPFADLERAPRARRSEEASLMPLGSLGDLARLQPGALAGLMPLLCEVEVPLGPEEELELDALIRQTRAAARGGVSASPLHALSFWLMKRRAGRWASGSAASCWRRRST